MTKLSSVVGGFSGLEHIDERCNGKNLSRCQALREPPISLENYVNLHEARKGAIFKFSKGVARLKKLFSLLLISFGSFKQIHPIIIIVIAGVPLC